MVGARHVTQLREQQVNPGGKLDRRSKLEVVVLDPGTKRAAIRLYRELGDGPAIEMAAFGARDRDVLGQVLQELAGVLRLGHRGVTEHAGTFDRKRGSGAHRAVGGHQSVYRLMVWSSRCFSEM